MKCILCAVAVALVIAMAPAATRLYDVDVYKNVNGKVPGGPNYGVSQTFVCTADSLLWAEFFVGAANATGDHYDFQVFTYPDHRKVYEDLVDCHPESSYRYVRANLAKQTNDALVKGETYVLTVTLSSQNQSESLNFYYNPWGPYRYGEMSVPGTGFCPPPGSYTPDLCARIEGIVYDNPEMVSTWDMIPWFLVKPQANGHDSTMKIDSAKSALGHGARMMQSHGIRGNRIVDLWSYVQPYPDSESKFVWDSVDICWDTLASHGVHPHLIAQGGGRWPLWDTLGDSAYMPTNMFEPIYTASGDSINPNNHLAWFY